MKDGTPAGRSPARRGAWRVAAIIAGGVLLLLVVARLILASWASGLEEKARQAWRAGVPPRPAASSEPRPTEADAGALRLEADARALGIELAPAGSARAREPSPSHDLDLLHQALLRRIVDEEPVAKTSPALADWVRESSSGLDALALGLISGPAPRFDAAPASRPVRVPPSCERAAIILGESMRLQRAVMAPDGLDHADEHVLRPGVPRLSGLVLVEEALLLHALERGRLDDRAGAQRALMAVEQINAGLLVGASRRGEGPSLSMRLLVMHLVRLQAGVLRQLPLDEWPRGLVDARWRDIILGAIEDEGAILDPDAWPSLEGRGAGRAIAWTLRPLERASRARTRVALLRVIDAFRSEPCDPDVRNAWAQAFDAAPRWDPAAARWLSDAADAWGQAARADMELRVTRAVVDHRAGRDVIEDPECPSWRIDVVTRGGGALRLRHDGPEPKTQHPLPFELPLEAVP